jgi:hypothetical protein
VNIYDCQETLQEEVLMKDWKDESVTLGYRKQLDDVICGLLGSAVVVLAAAPLQMYFGIRRRSVSKRNADKHPPESAEYLMSLFLTRDVREPLIGDLNEEFAIQRLQFGVGAARVWYWGQTVRVLGKSPLLIAMSKLLRYASVLGALSVLRRLI